MRSRRDRGPELITILWRDIPSQVNAQNGRDCHRVPLSRRFQRAIDRAAVQAGLTDAHAYVAEMRRVSVACGDDLETAARTEAARLEELYDRVRLADLAANGGVERAAGGDAL